ncbi:TB2/DP1, HVA22 family-domain-containing protein [Phellopilus nigrolimitatus]|nr:TB2/DP1, HVA22 family-domain-containing protein [Phellopilus nigrolimitatus]
MIIYFTSRVISSTVAFLYPGYASYKTLSQRPASEEDLERWLMYWSVLGCLVGVEYVAEWLISWLPLYYPMKTIFLLYLSLPQTRGSSYLYINFLQPFFHYHEADIDAALVKLKTRAYSFVQGKLRSLWEQILGSLGHPVQPGASAAADAAQPPTMSDPVSGPTQLLGGLWRTYGPSVVAQGASLFTVASAAAAFQQRPQPGPGAQSQDHGRTVSQTLLERRRKLEAELASLPPSDEVNNSSGSDSDSPVTTIPAQHGSSAYFPASPVGSDADLRARVGQFEEVEVPSDVEGYDLSSAPRRGPTEAPPNPTRRTSWFGWGAAAADKGAKDD